MHRIARTLMLAISSAAIAQSSDWQHFQTESPYPISIAFGVDAWADDEVWAVGDGQYFTAGGFRERVMVTYRFDGQRWRFIEPPTVDDVPFMRDVEAIGPGEALAVGSYSPISVSQTFVMRYEGGSWSQISNPEFTGGSGLDAIGRAGEDIWAGGLRRSLEPPPAVGNVGLALKWTGSGWETYDVEPLATLGGRGFNSIRDIDGVAEDDAWGVGAAQQTGSTDPFGPTPYIVRWAGGDRWELVDVGIREFGQLGGVEAIARDDVWAVGSLFMGADGGTQPLILHWDGSSWTRADVPFIEGRRAELRAVAARSATEVYASGTDADADGRPRQLMLKYDGSSWQRIDAAPTAGIDQWFRSMDVTPVGDVWAMGQYYRPSDDTQRALAQRLTADATCRPDLDGDGVLPLFDFLACENLVDASDPTADFDGDGELTLFDFLAFQNAFDAGCE